MNKIKKLIFLLSGLVLVLVILVILQLINISNLKTNLSSANKEKQTLLLKQATLTKNYEKEIESKDFDITRLQSKQTKLSNDNDKLTSKISELSSKMNDLNNTINMSTSSPKIIFYIQLSAYERNKLTQAILNHFNFANDHDWKGYASTIVNDPPKYIKDAFIFSIWRAVQKKKVIVSKISYETTDYIGRLRVVADVEWNGSITMFSMQKFGDDWKIAGVD